MYIFLDEITFRYRGAPAPALDRVSLFVRSGEIVAIVGAAGAGKTTLLRYAGRRSDGTGGVFLGSEADESEEKPSIPGRPTVRSASGRICSSSSANNRARNSSSLQMC